MPQFLDFPALIAKSGNPELAYSLPQAIDNNSSSRMNAFKASKHLLTAL
jgi:hypothetical protein